jgi:SPP1 family predicted phage head-tail adaptor
MDKIVINSGEFRTLITLQTPTVNVDAGAAQSEAWANFSTDPNVYARIINAHGAESVSADAKKAPSRMTLTIRYRADVNATHAFLLDGKRWKIITPPDNIRNRNEYLEMQAELIEGTV